MGLAHKVRLVEADNPDASGVLDIWRLKSYNESAQVRPDSTEERIFICH